MTYALFFGADYYPFGGWSDFKGTFPTIALAKEAFEPDKSRDKDWAEIANLDTLVMEAWYGPTWREDCCWHDGPRDDD